MITETINIKRFESGTWVEQIKTTSFSPNSINHDWIIDDGNIQTLLEVASLQLGKLNGIALQVKHFKCVEHLFKLREAFFSCSIDGLKIDFETVLMNPEELGINKQKNQKKVLNYVQAYDYAKKELGIMPFTNQLVKDTHREMMLGINKKNKIIGEFRMVQNWVGQSLQNAAYVPPYHLEVQGLMRDLELFVHNKKIAIPALIKSSLMHYQFEMIHPFIEGNGRMGRLMIPLQLSQRNYLEHGAFIYSEYLNTHKTDYFKKLRRVRRNHELTQWMEFYLEGMVEASKKAINILQDVIQLQQKVNDQLVDKLGIKSKKAKKLFKELYKNPIVDSRSVPEIVDASTATANRLLDELVEMGLLKEMTGFRRNRKFIFKDYLELFE